MSKKYIIQDTLLCARCKRKLSLEMIEPEHTLAVVPCTDCLKAEYDAGDEDGYERGYDEGRQEKE